MKFTKKAVCIGIFAQTLSGLAIAQVEIVAIENAPLPDRAGNFFGSFELPMIDDHGSVFYFANWGGSFAHEGLIAHENGISSLVLIGGDEFDTVPMEVGRLFDVIVSDSGMEGGIVAVSDDRTGLGNDEIVLLVNHSGAKLVHRDGDPAPVGEGNAFIRNNTLLSVSRNGDVGYPVLLSNTPGGSSDDRAVYRYIAGSDQYSLIVQRGDPYPENDGTFEGSCGGSLDLFCTPLMNDFGESMVVDVEGVFLEQSGVIQSVARIGQLIGSDTLDRRSFPKFNNNSQVAFSADILGNSSFDAIYINDDGIFSSVLLGDPAPSSFGPIFGIHRAPMTTQVQFNDLGEVLFGSDTFEPDPEGGNRVGEGLFVFDGSTTRSIARKYESAPGGGTYEQVHHEDTWTINDAGQVLFQARVAVQGLRGVTQTSYFLYTPDHGVQRLIGIGDLIDGKQVTGLSDLVTGYRSAGSLNNRGEVSLRIQLDNDLGAIVLVGGESACPADITGDGVLNFFDVSAFLQGFSNTDPVADFTGDGVWNFFDVSAFLQAFSAGCP